MHAMPAMNIRQTEPSDEAAVRAIHSAAFGPKEGPAIADLAVALLGDPTAAPLLSLLAFDDQTPIGHVLFTRVVIADDDPSPLAHILAPLAVLPNRHGRGVGGDLVRQGLAQLAESASELVFVLGWPEYYPRFGFQPAGRLGLVAPYPIAPENAPAWMVLELQPDRIGAIRGTVHCADELNHEKFWVE